MNLRRARTIRSAILLLISMGAQGPLAFAQGGVPLWTNTYSHFSSTDYATAAVADRAGNVFVTGYSTGGNGYEYATIAYSAAGIALWTNRYKGLGNGNNFAYAIA